MKSSIPTNDLGSTIKLETTRRYTRVILALFLLLPFPSLASESASNSEQLNEITVTGQRLDDRITVDQADLESHTGFARVVHLDNFKAQAISLTSIIDQAPGIQVSRAGGLGSYSQVFMRGAGGDQVSYYLDGMPLDSAQGNLLNLETLASSNLDSIQIFPDFTPATLGSSALGGAINFVTNDVYQSEQKLTLSAGSFETYTGNLLVSHQLDDVSFLVNLSGLTSANNYSIERDLTEQVPGDEYFESQHNDEFRQTGILTKTSWQWQPDRILTALIQADSSYKAVPSLNNDKDNNASLENDHIRTQFKLATTQDRFSTAHRLSFTSSQSEYSDLQNRVGLNADHFKTQEQRLALINTLGFGMKTHEFTVNLELSQTQFEQDNLLNGTTPVDTRRNLAVLALQDTLSSTDGRTQLNLIGRQYWQQDKGKHTGIEGIDRDVSEFTWTVGASHLLNTYTTVKANIGKGLRLPSLNETFGQSGRMLGNPDIKPEISHHADLGLIVEYRALQFENIVYGKKLEDAIITLFDSRGVGRPDNASKALVFGSDHHLKLNFNPVEFDFSASFVDTEDKSAIRAFRGQQLPGIYHQAYRAAVAYKRAHWRAELGYQFETDMFYDRTNFEEAEDRKSLNMGLTYAPADWSLALNIDNLTNVQYADFDKFPVPGRSITLTVSTTL